MAARVLIIDAPPQSIAPLIDWLRRDEHEVLLASAREVKDYLRGESIPDLILLNDQPRAADVVRALRRNKISETTPIAVIVPEVPNGSNPLRAELFEAGANDMLIGPLQSMETYNRLNRLLQRPAQADRHLASLEATCQAAAAALDVQLAWLLTVEGVSLTAQAITCERGAGVAETFQRICRDDRSGAPFLLIPGHDLIATLTLYGDNQLNLTADSVRGMSHGEAIYNALTAAGLGYFHLLPITDDGRTIGTLVFASEARIDTDSARTEKLIQAVITQSCTAIVTAQRLNELSAREASLKQDQIVRRLVMDTMGDGLALIDEKGRILYTNNRLLRMSGYTRQELYGSSIALIFHPNGRDQLMQGLLYRERTTMSLSQQLVTKTGAVVPILMSRAQFPPELGRPQTVLVLTDLTEQRSRESALERQEQRLRILNVAAQAITSANTRELIIDTVLHYAFETVHCVSACVYLRDPDDPDRMRAVAASGPQFDANSLGISIRVGEGIIGRAVEQRQTVMTNSIQQGDYRLGKTVRLVEREGSAVIAVPMMIMEEVIGVIQVINKSEGAFDRDDMEVLENLAASAAAAIENAQLFSQAHRQVNELSMMLDASAAVSSTLDIGSVLELITRRLTEALGVAECSIASWDQQADQLTVLARAINAYWKLNEGPVRPMVNTPMVNLLVNRQQTFTARANDNRIDIRLRDHMIKMGMNHVLMTPLDIGDQVVGSIELFNAAEDSAFTVPQMLAVREAIGAWRQEIGTGSHWHEHDHLTDLYRRLNMVVDPDWYIVSAFDDKRKTARALREIGFSVWNEQAGMNYRLQDYSTMKNSLEQGLVMQLIPALLFGDPNERTMMAGGGMATGLVIPLVIHGGATGLVRLADVEPNRTFDIAEISLCQGIANVIANALENARLYQSLEKRAKALQTAYDGLQESDRVKDDLIQNLSHELKTPLQHLIFESALLADGVFGDLNKEQQESVQKLMGKLTHLGSQINDLVSIHASQTLQMGQMPLTEFLKRAIGIAQARVSRSSKRLITLLPDENQVDQLTLWADAPRLAEVFDQVFDNAIKFSPSSDRIELHVRPSDSIMIEFVIKDFGVGIAKPEFEKIFQRGYQIDSSATRRFGGTGLGLAIAKQIIDGHGGKIWVESTPGSGTALHFTVPRWMD